MNPLNSARAELESLRKQKVEIDLRIDAVTKTIKLLEPLYGRDVDRTHGMTLAEMMAPGEQVEDLGLTAAVHRVLMAKAGDPLFPTQVRDLLVESGYPIRGDNPMASVHTVLKRLASRPDGSVIAKEHGPGKTTYKYVAQPSPRNRLTAPSLSPPPGMNAPVFKPPFKPPEKLGFNPPEKKK
jgi:hypothetical protein